MSLAKKINLRKDEEIVMIIKAYFFTYAWLYLLGFIFMGTASFLMFWLFSQGVWGYAGFALIMLIGLYIIFRTWYFSNKNFSVITTERLVDICRVGWFDEYLSAIHFTDVADVYVRKQGIWSNILNYGSVAIEAPDEQRNFELINIKAPQRILDLIFEYKSNFDNNKKLRDKNSIYKAFIKIMPTLDEAQLCEINDLIDAQLKMIDQEQVEDETEGEVAE